MTPGGRQKNETSVSTSRQHSTSTQFIQHFPENHSTCTRNQKEIEDQNIRLTSTISFWSYPDYNRITSVQESSQEERNSVIHEFSRTLKKWLSCLHHIISCSLEMLAKGLAWKDSQRGGARFRSWTRTHSVLLPPPLAFFLRGFEDPELKYSLFISDFRLPVHLIENVH